MAEPIRVGSATIAPGSRSDLELRAARLPNGTWLALPVAVLHGARPGPKVWLDAAIHGDELNGMEIIRRVLDQLDPAALRGSLIAVPIVNVFGFVLQDRYLPDRRDLNRCFPGSPKGSLAARLAHLFLTEVVDRCRYGIDLHTGSLHRTNLPQIRGNLKDAKTRRLAEAFGAPLILHSRPIAGSLRAVAVKRRIPILVYEAGEPLRFNREAIETGVRGVLRVLTALEMWNHEQAATPIKSFEAAGTRWVRAGRSGIFHRAVALGETVARHQVLGRISDPFSSEFRKVRAPFGGLVIGYTNNPLVHQGDAVLHLARGTPVEAVPRITDPGGLE